MPALSINVPTPGGAAACQLFTASQPSPAVILYMDAFGVRPVLWQMAERLASNGYTVLVPDLYYRAGKQAAFDPATAFKDAVEKERLGAARKDVTNGSVMQDTAAYLDFLLGHAASKDRGVGVVGYCMGGALALCAAGTFPEKIRAAASFHGGRLATDQADSPHLLAPKMKAEIYVGIAGIDPHFTPEEKSRLETALQSAHVRHTIEVYPEVQHGFAIADHPAYNEAAAERHWRELLKLFAENL